MPVKLHRKWRENNAVLFRAAQVKDRAESEDDAREGGTRYYWPTPLSGWGESKVSGRVSEPHRPATPTPSIALRMHPIAHPGHPFRNPHARGASIASQQQRCETRGLLFLIAAHALDAVLWSTWRLCSIARYALQEFSGSAWFRMITQRPLHCHSPHPCSLIWVADTGPGLCRLLGTFRRTLLLQSINIVPPIARVFAHVT